MADPRWVFHHRLTVRFSDCDLLGHVNNAVYLTYFEECRLEWWRTFGDRPMGTAGFGVIIAHCSCNYRAPAFVSDRLEVSLAVAAIPEELDLVTDVIYVDDLDDEPEHVADVDPFRPEPDQASVLAAVKVLQAASKPVIVYCNAGNTSGGAVAQLRKAGFANVVNLSGGYAAWQQAGLPVEK